EYDTIEQRIHEAEERAAALHKLLEDPATYTTRSGDEINALITSEKEARAEAERPVERWRELSERAGGDGGERWRQDSGPVRAAGALTTGRSVAGVGRCATRRCSGGGLRDSYPNDGQR